MQQMIDKITERLEQTIHDIIYWKTPKHGYRSREEMESDKRYQELINTKFLLEMIKSTPKMISGRWGMARWKFVIAGFMKSIFRKKWQN